MQAEPLHAEEQITGHVALLALALSVVVSEKKAGSLHYPLFKLPFGTLEFCRCFQHIGKIGSGSVALFGKFRLNGAIRIN